MFITTLSINVRRSRANRSLVMDVFSFVDLLFIIDPPWKVDGGGVVHEHVNCDLFSFVLASRVEVFVRSSLSGMFMVDKHDFMTCVVMYDVDGVKKRLGDVYVPPTTTRSGWAAIEQTWEDCDALMDDFNARHASWDLLPRPGSMHINDCRGNWLSDLCDRNHLSVRPPGCYTFRSISTIDLFIGAPGTRVSYDGKAGLEHVAVIARLVIDQPDDLVQRPPAWRKISASDCDDILDHVAAGSDEGMWTRLKGGVAAPPRSGRDVGRCPFWNPDLQRIRTDLNRMRWIKRKLPVI